MCGMDAVMSTFSHPTVLTSMQYAISATFAAGMLLSAGTPLTQLLNGRAMVRFLPAAVLFYTSVLSSKYILQVDPSTSRAAAARLPSLLPAARSFPCEPHPASLPRRSRERFRAQQRRLYVSERRHSVAGLAVTAGAASNTPGVRE